MTVLASSFVGSVLAALTVSTAALAQSYYDDQACRQFADAQTAPLRDQVNSQAIGGTLLGAGLGAAVGAAVAGLASERPPVQSSAPVSALPTPRTRRDTCSSSTTAIMRSAWRPADSRHRHMLRRHLVIHPRPDMPRPRATPCRRATRRRARRTTGNGLNRKS
jgi:hypothetical protein